MNSKKGSEVKWIVNDLPRPPHFSTAAVRVKPILCPYKIVLARKMMTYFGTFSVYVLLSSFTPQFRTFNSL